MTQQTMVLWGYEIIKLSTHGCLSVFPLNPMAGTTKSISVQPDFDSLRSKHRGEVHGLVQGKVYKKLTNTWSFMRTSTLFPASIKNHQEPSKWSHGASPRIAFVPEEVPFFTFSYELLKGRRVVDLRSPAAVLLVCVGSAFCAPVAVFGWGLGWKIVVDRKIMGKAWEGDDWKCYFTKTNGDLSLRYGDIASSNEGLTWIKMVWPTSILCWSFPAKMDV